MLERIGKYEIQREIGRGGFGHVYLGFDPTVGRSVAIKVMTAEGDPSMLSRFRTEATAAGNLRHENIVTVYDFGEDRGMFFMVMEYLNGRDLQHVIVSQESRTLIEKVRIMTQVAEGLHCAHQGGVVHRDIKPANIMLLQDGKAKIMDFGIARLTHDNSARLTQSGFLIGTVSYMAPEQFRGVEADVLCDIWSYGTIYYELLTGRNPFHASENHATMFNILSVEPERIRDLCPEFPEAIENIVMRLLSKDRESRYQSLEDVLFDVAPILPELEKARSAELLSQARALIAARKLEEAQDLVRKVLDFDPVHRDGRILRKELQDQLKRRSIERRIHEFRGRAEQAAAEGNYTEAIHAIGSAVQIDPADPELRRRLQEFEATKEQKDEAKRLLAKARNDLELQKLTSAFQSVTDALNLEPDNQSARDLASEIETRIKHRDSETRFKNGMSRVKGLLVLEAFDEAIEVLEGLSREGILAGTPQAQEVSGALERTRNQRREHERRSKIQAGTESAKALIKSGDFAAAIATLEPLEGEFPEERTVAQMLIYARDELAANERAARIKALGNEAWAKLKAEDFAGALQLVEQGLVSFPENQRLVHLREVITAARSKYERKVAIQQAIDEAAEIANTERLEDAQAHLMAALRRFPGDEQLEEARANVQARYEEQQRKRAESLGNVVAQAQRMVDSGRANEATLMLEHATSLHPSEPKIAALLSWAREEQVRQFKQREMNEVLARVAAFEAQENIAAALEAAEAGCQVFPSSPELAAAAERLLTRAALERDFEAIRAAIVRKDFSGALTVIEAARQRCPKEESFQRILQRFADEVAAGQRQGALDSACAEIRQYLKLKALDQAREALEKARRTLGPDTRLSVLEVEIARAFERRQSLETAWGFYRERNFEAAKTAAQAILDRDPSDAEAQTFLGSVGEEQEKERRRRDREQRMQAAQQSLRDRRFDEAEDILRALLAAYPGDPAILDDLKAVQDAKALFIEREAYANGRAQADFLLKQRRFDEALRALRQLLARFPRDATLDMDLVAAVAAKQEYERRERYTSERRKAADFVSKGEFEAAIRILGALDEEFPNDPLVKEELKASKDAKALRQQRDIYERGRAEAEDLARKREFDAAIRRLQALLKQFKGDAVLQQGLEAAMAGKAAHEGRQLYSAGYAEARKLARERKFDAAIRKLESLLQQFPLDPALEEELQLTLSTKALHSERLRVNERVEELEKLYRRGKAQSVRDQATALLAEIEEPRARELLDWAEKMIARPPSVDMMAPPPAKSNRAPIWILAGVLLVVGTMVFWRFSLDHRDKLSVTPGDLSFTYDQKKGRIPDPLKITVTSSNPKHPWEARSLDEWISATAQGSSIMVSVKPGGFGPGEYSGLLVIAADDQRSRIEVRVRLRVVAPPTPSQQPREAPKADQRPIVKPAPAPEHPPEPKQITPTDPEPPRPSIPPPVDCSPAAYTGDYHGDLVWIGNLPPDGIVYLARYNRVSGDGFLKGGPLPGCAVKLTGIPPTVAVEEQPSETNHFGWIRLRNKSPGSITLIRFSWDKQ
jgi:serine/threonine protein kinase